MLSARRFAQQAQCGSGQTSQTTSASQPARRPMLNAMSADKYMRVRYARPGPSAQMSVDRARRAGALASVRGGDRVAQ